MGRRIPVQRPSREELIALAKADPEAIADLVLALWDSVEALKAKVASLELKVAELERNSRPSSKPPSSDKGNFTNPPKPKPKSLRKKSGRKSGRQKGHPGATLEKVADLDHRVNHDLPAGTSCRDCGKRLPESSRQNDDWETRQVFDLPPISLEVTEHRARRCACPDCGSKITAGDPSISDAAVTDTKPDIGAVEFNK